MNVAIVGSRTFNDYGLVKKTLDKFKQDNDITKIISGGARGADSLGARYARENQIELLEFIPDWNSYGRGAGPIRNRSIINACDSVIAFWDGTSKGTANSISQAKDAGRKVEIVLV